MITPNDVRNYTAFKTVTDRADNQLTFDILQAQHDIFDYAGHNFSDSKYSPLPDEVKLAFIKLSEYYALINADESFVKGVKSEKLGDYQYTLQDGETKKFSLSTLLKDHVQASGTKGSSFKVRSF